MKSYELSVCIPSWNNLPYLKNCIASILENSSHHIQIIVFLNENSSESRAWLKSLNHPDISILSSEKNVGICVALNEGRKYVKSDYFVYINDDMYCLPGWDDSLIRNLNSIPHNRFMISCTMIEPEASGNPVVVVGDYGKDIENFEKESLLAEYQNYRREDWSGSSWPPVVLHTEMWDRVGGMSIEFSPGYYSDPDLAMKLYEVGVREFRGLGQSLVYHFGKKSTSKIPSSNGKKLFLCKWGISASTFYRQVLKMGKPYARLAEVAKISLFTKTSDRIKRLMAGC